MQMLVGLGNPGARHAANRHNIGFMALERIAQEHGFGAWRSKFRGEAADGRIGGEKVVLLRPHTFMNESGVAVSEAMRFYKLAPAQVTALHDDLELAPGKIRVKTGGGHAGHNGLRSIDQHIGPEYQRVRIGIGRPADKRAVTGHVLGDFAAVDQEWLEALLRGVSEAAPLLVAGQRDRFLGAATRHVFPPGAAQAAPGEAAEEPAEAADAPAKAEETPAEAAASPDAAPAGADGGSPLRRLLGKVF